MLSFVEREVRRAPAPPPPLRPASAMPPPCLRPASATPPPRLRHVSAMPPPRLRPSHAPPHPHRSHAPPHPHRSPPSRPLTRRPLALSLAALSPSRLQVHSVKALFADKEQALQVELRERTGELEAEARRAHEAAKEAEEAGERQRCRADDAERARKNAEAEQARSTTAQEALSEQLSAGLAELAIVREDKERVEGEMRLVLRAMEQQKQAAARNMSQLSKIYTDWSTAVNA